MYITSVFLLFFVTTVKADCASDKSNIPYVKLKNDLLCSYDSSVRPVANHKTAVPLFIRMMVKYFSYEMLSSSFEIDSWIVLMWKDEHLKWDPSKYDSITFIHLPDSSIWVPDISVYNRRIQGGSPSAIDSVTCIVHNDGKVICVPSSHESSLCVPNLTKYPFDTQNCTIRFGSWVHSGEELDIQLIKSAVSFEDLVPNGEWELIDAKAIKHPGKFKCCPNNTYPSINFSFKFRRLVGAHIATIILPAIALIILTLTSLWVAPDKPERLYLCSLNVICEFLHLQYVSWTIPFHGSTKTPLILLFARDSLLLATLTVIFSILLKSIVVKDKPAPAWLSNTITVLTATKPGQFVFLNDTSAKGVAAAQGDDDGAAIISNQVTSPATREWITFARILDILCFIIYCILYFTMFIAFVP